MKIPIEELHAAILADDYTGFCLSCGNEQSGCEPDARKYKCDVCDERTVYGAEEILIMGEYE